MAGETAVSVDRDFARFGSKSFAINKINTVDVQERYPYAQSAVFVWGLLALLSLGFLGGASAGGILFVLMLSAFFGFLAYRAWVKSKIIEYQLFLVTSSHSVQAIKSQDGPMIESLRTKIEQAMAGRL